MSLDKPIVVNIFAGPGAGKSTNCAEIFAKLKRQGINCEMSLEYAKRKVWEDSLKCLEDQIYIFGKQQHNQFILTELNDEGKRVKKVDAIITDSPLPNSLIYGDNLPQCFKDLVMFCFEHNYYNLNYYLIRTKPYNPKGRYQDEDGAKAIDDVTKQMLDKYNISYTTVYDSDSLPEQIARDVITALRWPQ
jgi:tRNA uridine 5-carbamoylmethylation protein Kti12